jgi:hypothetical protein
MNGFVKYNNPFKDITTRHKSCFGGAHNFVCYMAYSICENFSNDFERNIKEANRYVVLDFICIIFLWD